MLIFVRAFRIELCTERGAHLLQGIDSLFSQLPLSGLDPWRVVEFGDRDGFVGEKLAHGFYRYIGKEEFNGKCIAQHMGVKLHWLPVVINECQVSIETLDSSGPFLSQCDVV